MLLTLGVTMENLPLDSNIEHTDDLFYFESDHLALKGNNDYSELLKTIFVLESQRKRAIEVCYNSTLI